MKKIGNWINCHIFNFHKWTCKASEGIEPRTMVVGEDVWAHFKDYAKMYCKHCGKESELNKRLK